MIRRYQASPAVTAIPEGAGSRRTVWRGGMPPDLGASFRRFADGLEQRVEG